MMIIDGKQGDTYFGFWEYTKAVLTVIGGVALFAIFGITLYLLGVAECGAPYGWRLP